MGEDKALADGTKDRARSRLSGKAETASPRSQAGKDTQDIREAAQGRATRQGTPCQEAQRQEEEGALNHSHNNFPDLEI